MTFDNTASAINGSQLSAAILRRANFAALGNLQGIVKKNDLKVKQLATPGVGVLIEAGVGIVLNKYQTSPNESYVVSNPSTHTISSGSMPASNPAAKSYILAVVIGDKDFSQTGHPFMLSTDPPAGQELTFAYVRPVFIEVANNTITTLNVNYPALPLARVDIPANTTTITDAMITNLATVARPLSSQEIFVGNPWTNASPRYIPSGSSYADWGPQEYSPSVKVPTWAKRAIVVASINGVRLADSSSNVTGGVRTQLGSVTGPASTFDIPSGTAGALRMNLQTAGSYDVTSIAGTTAALRVEGFEDAPASPPNSKRLALQAGSQMIFDVRFFEE